MAENFEIKVKAKNLSSIERVARSLGRCIFKGRQQDTYFRVQKGRLKLRETRDQAELIFYLRPDQSGAKWSSYVTFSVDNPRAAKALLTKLFGLAQVVKKYRKVYLHRNARIHLDKVTGLGTFVELEVMKRGRGKKDRTLMKSLIRKLGLSERQSIKGSYADLLQSARK